MRCAATRRDALPPSAAGRCGSPRRSVVVRESFRSTSARDSTRVPFGHTGRLVASRHGEGGPASPPVGRAMASLRSIPPEPRRARKDARVPAHMPRAPMSLAPLRCSAALPACAERASECRRSSATPSTCCLCSTSSSTSARREHSLQPCTQSHLGQSHLGQSHLGHSH
jgi:hypothetical protein